MDGGGIICLLLVGLFVFGVVGATIIHFFPGASSGSRKQHSADHPGLVKNGRDVICPKCKSPYCQYYFEEKPLTAGYVKTKTKVHPLNPFKPFVEEKHRVIPGQTYQQQRFRCTNCGWIFD